MAPRSDPRARKAPRRRSGQAGQSLAEFAVILFVLVLIIMGIIDLARAVYARSVIANAAREGARYGVINPTDTAGIENAARRLTVGLEDPAARLTVQVTRPDEQHVQVEITYLFRAITALMAQCVDGGSGSGVTLRARTLMRVE